MKKSLFISVLLIIISAQKAVCQNTKGFKQELVIAQGEQELFGEAEEFFENQNYISALPLYEELDRKYQGVAGYKFKIGVCLIYKGDQNEKSIKYLEEVRAEKPKTQDINFYLARAYQINNRFDDAIKLFKEAKDDSKTSGENKIIIDQLVGNCKNGIELVKTPLDVEIENMGKSINSEWSEYVPVLSSDETTLIFTYKGIKSKGGLQDEFGVPDERGQYFEDIFISNKVGDNWLAPESIGDKINTTRHDACIAISGDGQKLFIYRDEGSGDIFYSKLDSNIWSVPIRLNENINTKYWEGSASLSPDEKTLYFASNRPGGYGGRDLYKSVTREDGIWGEAVNLGPVINSKLDDDGPFIHPDGKTLYFSSEGHNSMGGHDIFVSTIQEDATWIKPENMGYPINTAGDDKYYVVSPNGERGYYSSSRSGGTGLQDIYIVHKNKAAKKHILIMVKGIVTVDKIPAEAEITVKIEDSGEILGTYNSNAAKGNYLINLAAGNNYEITFEVQGVEPHYEKINGAEITEFKEEIINVEWFIKPLVVLEESKKEEPEKEPEEPLAAMDMNDPAVYRMVLEKYGNTAAENLYFTVQIGAYQNPEQFEYANVSDLGKVEKKILEDGITRFTINRLKTLNEAETLKQKVLKRGNLERPFILVFYNNERKQLSEVVRNRFYAK